MSFHFVLKRKGWGYDDLYAALKSGEKTSEWRDGIDHWRSRLLTERGRWSLRRCYEIQTEMKGRTGAFLMAFPEYFWKHKRARFVVGYTSSPMLVADVKAILYHAYAWDSGKTDQFEIRIENVEEVRK